MRWRETCWRYIHYTHQSSSVSSYFPSYNKGLGLGLIRKQNVQTMFLHHHITCFVFSASCEQEQEEEEEEGG